MSRQNVMSEGASVPLPRTLSGDRSGHWIGWGLGCAFGALFLAVLWGHPVNHDTAWYLVATEAWRNGAALYADIVEVNPPLAFYLTRPVLWLADMLRVSPSEAQHLSIALLLALALGWSWSLLPGESLWRRLALLVTLAAALTLPFLAAVAQREHIMLLLMTPWVIGRLTGRDDGDAMRALLAAPGLCLKPYFMAYPLSLTLWEMAVTRSWRPIFAPSNLVFLGAGLVYIAGVALFHPGYFTEIIPTAAHVYGEYGLNTFTIFLRFVAPGLILALALLVLVAQRYPTPALPRLLVLLLAAIVIYLVQWTGFDYQFFPVSSFAMIGLGWMLFAPGATLSRPVQLLAVIALGLMSFTPLARGPYANAVIDVLSNELEQLDTGTRLMSFSTSLSPGSPVALRNDLVWTSRYPALWLVPGVVDGLARASCATDSERCAALREIGQRTRDDILTDLVAGKPDILIFDRHHDFIETPGFYWEGFLGVDPRWAPIMAQFNRVKDGGGYEIYLHQSLTDP